MKDIQLLKLMILNRNSKLLILTCFISGIMLSSCGSSEQKSDGAIEHFKKERLLSKKSDSNSNETIQAPKKAELLKKNEIPDEWAEFRIETEKKIRTNDNIIREIKGRPDISASMLRKVKSLEKNNNDLRIKMDEYKEEMKVKFENFKTTINHDANEIGIELKVVKIDIKK